MTSSEKEGGGWKKNVHYAGDADKKNECFLQEGFSRRGEAESELQSLEKAKRGSRKGAQGGGIIGRLDIEGTGGKRPTSSDVENGERRAQRQ